MTTQTYPVQTVRDIVPLQAILDGLVGEKAWEIQHGYARSFRHRFGAKESINDLSSKRSVRYIPSWSLSTLGTTWRIDVPDAESIHVETEAARKHRCFEQFLDLKVTGATVLYPSLGLRLDFENGFRYWLLPAPEDDKYALPYWRLFTPDDVHVQVGPKSQWSVESDDIANEFIKERADATDKLPSTPARMQPMTMGIKTYSIQTPTDIEPVQAILDKLVGEKSWRIEEGYADNFFLDFGAKKPINDMLRKNPVQYIAAWSIETCGTTWRIDVPNAEPVHAETEASRKESYFAQFRDLRVTGATVLYPSLGLRLDFENGFRYWLLPEPEDDEYNLPYWSMLTPKGILINVGPKAQWTQEGRDVENE